MNLETEKQSDKAFMVRRVIWRWIELNSKIDTVDYTLALERERLTFKNIMSNANTSQATLINCTKTGQPIGQLFDHVGDAYLPSSIAPNWLRTGSKALETKLTEQPCALLVFMLEKLCLGHNGLQNYVENTYQQSDILQIIDTANALRAEVYEKIIDLDKSCVFALLYLIHDVYEFLKYPGLALDKMHSIGVCVYECESDDLYSELIEHINDVYVSYFDKVCSKNEVKGIAMLDDDDFVIQVDRVLGNASKKINVKSNEDLYKNKLLNLPIEPRLTRKGVKAKAEFDMMQELENVGLAQLSAADIGFRDISRAPDLPEKKEPAKRNIFDVLNEMEEGI